MDILIKFVDTPESGTENLDVDSIRELVCSSVNRALEFLRESGFEYSHDLHVSYICGKFSLAANAALRANYRVDEYQGIRDGMEVMRVWLSMFHHLELSDGALDEFAKYVEKSSSSLRHSAPHEIDDGADIFIYNVADLDNLCDLLVHELWHLIEAQAGVFKISEFIHEGTATYVQKKFIGMNFASDAFFEGIPTAYALYDLVGKIVAEELEMAQGSLSKLLDPTFRKKLSDRVKTEVLPLYFEAFDKENSAQQKAMIINNPNYAAFIDDPSRKNLIEAFRSMGAVKWADELDKQDISSYLEHCKRVIGKTS